LLELLPSTVDIISRSFGFVKGDFEISLKNLGNTNPLVWIYKEEKMSADIFSELFLACAAGAKEARSRASLDSRRPEEVSSGHLCVLEVE